MHVTATFHTRTAAESALSRLEAIGVHEDQISVLMTEESRGNHFKIEQGTKADEGAAAGATLGGIVGAVLGGILAAGTIAIPGLNLVIAGGLAAGLAGLGAGALTGGLVGALIGLGIPEHEAKIYEKEIQEGNILLAVKPSGDEQKKRIKAVLETSEAYNVAA